MRKLPLLMLLVIAVPASAQPLNRVALGYQQMTSLVAAAALPSIPSGASEAFIVCTGQTVYWRDDGTDPTASVGVPLPVNTGLPYIGSLARMKIIQTTPTAVCNVSYYQ